MSGEPDAQVASCAHDALVLAKQLTTTMAGYSAAVQGTALAFVIARWAVCFTKTPSQGIADLAALSHNMVPVAQFTERFEELNQ